MEEYIIIPEWKAGRSEKIRKVNREQSKEGNRRAEIIEMKLDSQNVTFLKFTNERNPEVVPVTVTKKWVNTNPDVKQPTEVEVQLIINGNVADTQKLNDANKWTYTWENVVTDTASWDVKETCGSVHKEKAYTNTFLRPKAGRTIRMPLLKVN